MATEKKQHTIRLSVVGDVILSELTSKLGIGIAGVMELALRRLADIEGLDIPKAGEERAE